MQNGLKVVLVPDPQIKTTSCLDHLEAASNLICEEKPDVIVAIGDWCDMPSLSKHASNIELEGTRIKDDIEAGMEGMRRLLSAVDAYNDQQIKNKKKLYKPRMVFTTGNHCPATRIRRLVSEVPVLDGYLEDSFGPWIKSLGWEVYDFLEVANVEGIRVSHYFQNPHSAKKAPIGGTIDNMIKSAGFSFIQGHTQGLKWGKHYLGDGTQRIGLVAGSFYLDKENYMGAQGDLSHWRGLVVLDDVKNGTADIREINIHRLMREYL